MMSALPVRAAYGLLGVAITPALSLWLARRARRGKEDSARKHERFGHAGIARPTGTLVWLHAASVGETQSVLTLVRALLHAHPTLHLLITTGTVTSAALVAQQNLPRVIHQFVPVDTYPAVRRFLRHWQPDLALWVESEFWPQLVWQAQARRIPMLLLNARISAKTYANWQRWPNTIRSILRGFTTVYAGATEYATRLRDLGAVDVRDVGNLKYDAAPLAVDAALMDELATVCAGRPVFVSASTHANEEQILAEVHGLVAQQFPALLTIIVPRHATRGNAIAADLRARGVALAQRSAREAITPTTAIYLADTMGELGSFYRLADVVFIGGSLIAHGGQNPLEAARLSNALITGTHTHNFSAIIARLVAADAIRVVSDKAALAATVSELLAQDTTRLGMAERASGIVMQAQGASAIILQQCDQLLARSTA
jgi:3-deoxy-D-manno-octulosonic-acid transferase